MELSDLITIILFIIPGWISLYFIHIMVGYEPPKNNFERLIEYIFHNTVVIFLLWLFYKFVLKETFQYGLTNFIYIFPFAIAWGLIFSLLTWLLNKFELLPAGMRFNSSLFNDIYRNWFKDGYVKIRLKSGIILKGWIYYTEYDPQDNKNYIALVNYKRLREKMKSTKVSYEVIQEQNISNYQMIVVDVDNADYIELSHNRMIKLIKGKMLKAN